MACIKIPFQFVNGKLNTSDSADVAARQKIIDALTTDPYERLMRHGYGVGVRRFLYEIVDELEFADLKVDALQTIAETVSRVEILDMQLVDLPPQQYFGSDDTSVAINVIYRLPLGSPKVFSFNTVIPGSINEDSPI